MKKVKLAIEVLGIITSLIETYWFLERFIESKKKTKPVNGFKTKR